MPKYESKPGESLESLLKKFKRRVKNDGVLQDLRDRERYEKPSDKKKKERKAAQRRTYIQQQQDKL